MTVSSPYDFQGPPAPGLDHTHDDYYDPCYYMSEYDSRAEPRRDLGDFEIQTSTSPYANSRRATTTPTPPRSSPCMEEVVRRRTPAWISRLLKTNLPAGELEDLFANMLLLGRIADVIHGVLDASVQQEGVDSDGEGKGSGAGTTPTRSRRGITTAGSPGAYSGSYSTPGLYSPAVASRPQHISLGERPYRVMAQDYERFCALWSRLEIREDSRFSFHDVEQKAAGERIGLCIWDLCNALHDRSVTGELPEWVGRAIPKFTEPTEERSPVRSSPQKFDPGHGTALQVGSRLRWNLSPSPSPGPDSSPSPKQRSSRSPGKELLPSPSPHGSPNANSVYEMDASTRVLTSILTPGRGKPKHSKLLNAVMMSDFHDEGKTEEREASESGGSPLPRVVDRHDSTGSVDDAKDDKKAISKCSKGPLNVMKERRAHDDMMVHVSKFHRHGEEGDTRRNLFGGLIGILRPLALAAIGAVSVVVVQGVVAGQKERQWRRGVAGRW